LIAERQERESYFITIHFLAREASIEADSDSPKNITDLVRPYGSESELLKPFPDGLVYRPQGEIFILDEPASRWVSLFRKDRLISTNWKWPRWESTGEFARKIPEQ
jgi:hypothetical protein